MLKSLLTRFMGRTAPHVAHPSPLFRLIDARQLRPTNQMLRLGTQYGGWWIPRQHGLHSDSICYCAGAGEDISFDCELASRFNCHVRIIDPTPRAIAHFEQLTQAVAQGLQFAINSSSKDFYPVTSQDLQKIHFIPHGLVNTTCELKFYLPQNEAHVSCSIVNLQGTEKYFIATCKRLIDIISEHGDTHIDLLKMDIEGAEYCVIEDMLATHILPSILLIEFDEAHTPLDEGAPTRIAKTIQQLANANMQCIYVEASNATFINTKNL